MKRILKKSMQHKFPFIGLTYVRKYLLLVLIVRVFSADAQEANHWIFGKNVHIEFKKDSLYQYTFGDVNWLEGTSSISDSLGKLIYHTSNDFIRKSNNQKITPELWVDEGSTQGVLILKHTGAERFDFFTSLRGGWSLYSNTSQNSYVDRRVKLAFNGGESNKQ